MPYTKLNFKMDQSFTLNKQTNKRNHTSNAQIGISKELNFSLKVVRFT